MKLDITITTDKNNHITPEQYNIVKEELERILVRFTDPEFIDRTKNIVKTDKLVGCVQYPFTGVSVQHSVEEGIHEWMPYDLASEVKLLGY